MFQTGPLLPLKASRVPCESVMTRLGPLDVVYRLRGRHLHLRGYVRDSSQHPRRDAASDRTLYNEDHQIAICVACKHCVVPTDGGI